jgi:hypothetical protein
MRGRRDENKREDMCTCVCILPASTKKKKMYKSTLSRAVNPVIITTITINDVFWQDHVTTKHLHTCTSTQISKKKRSKKNNERHDLCKRWRERKRWVGFNNGNKEFIVLAYR